ncbi:hypothetical protein Pla8534_67450 [Lignipirellula cremea]|uniref:Uncharacterized protein n=1 Tax=Lignipirellula cremea TaxID=2528010 RepID=A0A518E415_9BACT|nr:hypothetical protein Pla8534_67450 [Lignipirellula cremea]
MRVMLTRRTILWLRLFCNRVMTLAVRMPGGG